MKFSFLFKATLCSASLLALSLISCNDRHKNSAQQSSEASDDSLISSVVRVNSTAQSWNASQPWDKKPPKSRSGLGALLSGNRVLTTATMATDTTYIELENADSTLSVPAKVIAIDYEANLALLEADNNDSDTFFEGLKAIEIGAPLKINDTLEIWQLEESGMPIVTSSTIQSVGVLPSASLEHYFLTYQGKGSMQSATSSYTLPAIKNNQLIGLINSYDSDEQLIGIIAPEIITAFLKDAENDEYQGFPALGVSISLTVDPSFRSWLQLADDTGGLYVDNVSKESSAGKSGIKKGDVITKIGNHNIGRRGYYTDKRYGRLYWRHLVGGSEKVNDTIEITVVRDTKAQVISVKLEPSTAKLIPSNTYDQAPRYLVKGGFIFQELTRSYLKAFGEEWKTKAPLDLLDVLSSPEDYEEGRNKVVILSATIPTQATTGYESLRSDIIKSVNGQTIADIPSLIEAFKTADKDGLHTIEIQGGKPETIYLDATTSDAVDAQLLQRGIPALSRE